MTWLGLCPYGPAVYLGLAVAVLNNLRAPYYVLDPGDVGAIAVAGNVGVLAAGFLALGYALVGMGWVAARARAAIA